MRLRALFSSLSTTLVVAGLAAGWSVASPLAAGCAAATPPDQLAAAPAESSQFVSAINNLRASKGLGPMSVDSNLSSIAQNWAVTMGEQDTIFHRSNLADGVTIDWTRLGENVGEGPTVNDLMNAFIASQHHYENLVDPRFNRIGVGTVRTPDGLLYTAHEFAAVANKAPAPAPATATPKATTAPKTYTPRSTTPRVTTRATTPPPPPPTTTTTTQPVEVSRSMAHHNKLKDGSADDQQQKNNKGNGRCGAQGVHKVVAAAASFLDRVA